MLSILLRSIPRFHLHFFSLIFLRSSPLPVKFAKTKAVRAAQATAAGAPGEAAATGAAAVRRRELLLLRSRPPKIGLNIVLKSSNISSNMFFIFGLLSAVLSQIFAKRIFAQVRSFFLDLQNISAEFYN